MTETTLQRNHEYWGHAQDTMDTTNFLTYYMPAYVVSFYKLCALISDQSPNPNQIHNHNYNHYFTQSQILAKLDQEV